MDEEKIEGAGFDCIGTPRFCPSRFCHSERQRARASESRRIPIIGTLCDFFECVCVGQVELAYGGAAKSGELGAATEALAHVMGYRAHEGSAGNACWEASSVVFMSGNNKFFDLDFNRLEVDFL